jgi:D-threo-aldose 1-dehydrogenase
LHYWWSDEVSNQHLPDYNYDLHNAPVMRVLREAKEQGLCRFIGITGNSAAELTHVLQHVEVDTFLVAFNYDLLWRVARYEALSVACKKGVAVILGGVFRNGSLAKVHPEWLVSPPKWVTPEIKIRLEQLYVLQQDCGLSLVTLTIRYLMADPNVTTILVGASTPAELEECVTAAQQGPLPSDLHQAIEDLGLP